MRHIRKASPVKPIKHTTLTRSQMHHSIIQTIQKKILEIATIIKLLNNTSEKKGCLNTMYFYHRSNHRPSSHIWHYTSGTEKASRCFLLMFSSSSKLPDPTPVPDPIHIKWCRNYDDETMSFDEELVQCIDYCRYYTMYVPSPAVEGGHAAWLGGLCR